MEFEFGWIVWHSGTRTLKEHMLTSLQYGFSVHVGGAKLLHLVWL